MQRISISAGGVVLQAQLADTPTARAIWQALPLEGTANTWGDEIYFDIPVDLAEEADARADVRVGELGYWPAGSAFCIFFGPTPASSGGQPRAASAVNIFGRISGDATRFKSVKSGAAVQVSGVVD
jgi:uncharacterized protein